jgi:hypothetical protein
VEDLPLKRRFPIPENANRGLFPLVETPIVASYVKKL